MKIFINIVKSDMIAPPGTKRGLVDNREEEGLNIPLSVSPSRSDVDHAGDACKVFDVAIHPAAVDRALQDQEFLNMVGSLAIEWIANKYTTDLNRSMYCLFVCTS